jgi:hypothetical protein
VNLEVTGEIRVKSLKIHARGHAKVRWTESRNAGSNTAYTQNYTEEVEYFNHKDILIGHERGKLCVSVRERDSFSSEKDIFAFLVCCDSKRSLAHSWIKVSKVGRLGFPLTFSGAEASAK